MIDKKTIKQLAKQLPGGRKELAEKTGVSKSSVDKWCMGINKPSRSCQLHIERLLKDNPINDGG